MSESFAGLKEIKPYDVRYQPNRGRPAFWDCPKVIRDAACGRAPRPIERSMFDFVAAGWPYLLVLGFLLYAGLHFLLLSLKRDATPFWLNLVIAIPFLALPPFAVLFQRHGNAHYEKLLALFNAHPEVYRDEIYKLAVGKLPFVDFQGRHRGHQQDAKIGRFELDLIAKLKSYGIEVETTVANRGRPFVIHQYELVELGWHKHVNGDSGNYVLDLAILWPERRIKYNIEVDGSSHGTEAHPFWKDVRRDEVLTERGWFVRRLNHKFLADEAKTRKALDEIVGVLFYFAKYADDMPFDFERRWDARVQNQRLRKQHAWKKVDRATANLPSGEQVNEKPIAR